MTLLDVFNSKRGAHAIQWNVQCFTYSVARCKRAPFGELQFYGYNFDFSFAKSDKLLFVEMLVFTLASFLES